MCFEPQAEATALAQPQIEGADIDCNFKGLDVLPLAAALDRGVAAKTQRLKLNGRTKVSVRLSPVQGPAEGETYLFISSRLDLSSPLSSCPVLADRTVNSIRILLSLINWIDGMSGQSFTTDMCVLHAGVYRSLSQIFRSGKTDQGSADVQHKCIKRLIEALTLKLGVGVLCAGAEKTGKQAMERPSAFSGDLSLDGLRVNQLKLSRNLTGTILLSDEQFQIRAKVSVKHPSHPPMRPSSALQKLELISACRLYVVDEACIKCLSGTFGRAAETAHGL